MIYGLFHVIEQRMDWRGRWRDVIVYKHCTELSVAMHYCAEATRAAQVWHTGCRYRIESKEIWSIIG